MWYTPRQLLAPVVRLHSVSQTPFFIEAFTSPPPPTMWDDKFGGIFQPILIHSSSFAGTLDVALLQRTSAFPSALLGFGESFFLFEGLSC